MKVSICIPVYDMKGKGLSFLQRNLSSIFIQSLEPYEVVISDHSTDDSIEKLANEWKKFLNIKYFKNERGLGNISANLNNCIEKSEGEILDFMFQDDFYFSPDSLDRRMKTLATNQWSLTSTIHYSHERQFYWHLIPVYRQDIYLGYNSIGSPSLLSMRKKDAPMFDENLFMLTDCDYYKQLYDKFGLPVCSPDITSVSYIWEGQSQRGVSENELNNEIQIVKQKYEN